MLPFVSTSSLWPGGYVATLPASMSRNRVEQARELFMLGGRHLACVVDYSNGSQKLVRVDISQVRQQDHNRWGLWTLGFPDFTSPLDALRTLPFGESLPLREDTLGPVFLWRAEQRDLEYVDRNWGGDVIRLRAWQSELTPYVS